MRLKSKIADATSRTLSRLEKLEIGVFGQPTGGYYIWGELPEDMDELEFAKAAAASSIFVAPGSMFYPDRSAGRAATRFNIAFASDPRFEQFYRTYRRITLESGKSPG